MFLNPLCRIFLNLQKVASYHADYNSGHIIAMVTYCATKLTATCSPMIGQFVDTVILASTSIELL